jgi:hypothetical protein
MKLLPDEMFLKNCSLPIVLLTPQLTKPEPPATLQDYVCLGQVGLFSSLMVQITVFVHASNLIAINSLILVSNLEQVPLARRHEL